MNFSVNQIDDLQSSSKKYFYSLASNVVHVCFSPQNIFLHSKEFNQRILQKLFILSKLKLIWIEKFDYEVKFWSVAGPVVQVNLRFAL